MPARASSGQRNSDFVFPLVNWTAAVVAVEMWETRSWRFPRKREIPRSWFLGDFPLPSFPPLAWIYETLLAGFDHPAGYFDSPTNSATEPKLLNTHIKSRTLHFSEPLDLHKDAIVSRVRE